MMFRINLATPTPATLELEESMNRLQFGPLAMLQQANDTTSVDKKSSEPNFGQATQTDVKNRPSSNSDLLSKADGSEEALSPNLDSNAAASADCRRFQKAMDVRNVLVHSNLFIPMHYEKNYAYPLIVFLHDHLQNESQIQRVMPQIDCRNYAAISLRSSGKIDSDSAWQQNESSIEHAHAALTKSIAHAQGKLNINPDKIFLVGSGAGATMALRLAFQSPVELAGVAALNGALPSDQTPFSRLLDARSVPIYWAHYRDCANFVEDDLCQGVSLLHSAGFNLTLRQYPVDSSGCRQVYSDLNCWIMEQVTA